MEHLQKYREILEAQLKSVTAELTDIAILDETTLDWIIKTTDIDHTEADESNLGHSCTPISKAISAPAHF